MNGERRTWSTWDEEYLLFETGQKLYDHVAKSLKCPSTRLLVTSNPYRPSDEIRRFWLNEWVK